MQFILCGIVLISVYLLQYSCASSVGAKKNLKAHPMRSSNVTRPIKECRSECLERNKYKIVRVHIKEDVVRAGVCRNVTTNNPLDVDSAPKSHVFPFICDKKIGIWEIDEKDEEGIADFSVMCPHVEEVQPEILDNCPKK